MIDIHCHILPGLDDGAHDVRESLEMARFAAREGIVKMIATPHHQNGKYHNPKADIIERTNEMNELLKTEQIGVEILPGQETRIYGDMVQDIDRGEILTLAGSSMYLFVELPSNHVPGYTEQLLFDLQMKGLIPIIVHPERNLELMEQPDKLYKLVKKGAAAQITAASITGYFGKKVQKFAGDIMEANLAHFIASDAHNIKGRSFKMAEAQELLSRRYGLDLLLQFKDNAEAVVSGQNIYREIPSPIKKKKLLWIF